MESSTIHREYKFGRHWGYDSHKVSLEVPREKALEQHRAGEGYTVLILENCKPRFVVGVNTGTTIRGVHFLDDSCETSLDFQFNEFEQGRLFLTWAQPKRKGIPHQPAGIVIGEGRSFNS